jgi:TM2 domain-containing membrane protein YozV
MRGKVLSYDDTTAQGLISGDDGVRYAFTRGDLNDLRAISAGTNVDFNTVENRATSIYALRGDTVGQVGDKNKIVAALFAFFLGSLGIHKFYLGKTTAGVIMLLCGTIGWILLLPGLAVCLIALIEFIIYLVKSDQDFYQDYVVGDKSWF